MSLRLITPPASTPITLTEAKEHLRVTASSEDTYITALIETATNHVEQYTNRAIVEQTWELVLDEFSDTILIPRGPVTSITSFKYFDLNSVEQTIDPANYALDEVGDPQWIIKERSYTWPRLDDSINNITIRFVAGYTTTPPAIKHAILLLVSHWYEMRGPASDRQIYDVPHAVDALLANYRSFAL